MQFKDVVEVMDMVKEGHSNLTAQLVAARASAAPEMQCFIDKMSPMAAQSDAAIKAMKVS